ncbi:MAG: dephospho-CoA kinase [Ignavibacteriales bacterium]
MSKKLKVAVTGGIGSGKTEFCNFLHEKGFPVISADRAAKEVLAGDPAVREKIIDAFGLQSYAGSEVNTRYLAETVFSDPHKVKLINSIVHPVVIRIIKQKMKEYLKDNSMVFVEAALIYEAEMEELFDYVVLITARDEFKIKRTLERGNIPEKEIRKRIENQIPDEEKSEWADFTFENNMGLQELQQKAGILISLLKLMAG